VRCALIEPSRISCTPHRRRPSSPMIDGATYPTAQQLVGAPVAETPRSIRKAGAASRPHRPLQTRWSGDRLLGAVDTPPGGAGDRRGGEPERDADLIHGELVAADCLALALTARGGEAAIHEAAIQLARGRRSQEGSQVNQQLPQLGFFNLVVACPVFGGPSHLPSSTARAFERPSSELARDARHRAPRTGGACTQRLPGRHARRGRAARASSSNGRGPRAWSFNWRRSRRCHSLISGQPMPRDGSRAPASAR